MRKVCVHLHYTLPSMAFCLAKACSPFTNKFQHKSIFWTTGAIASYALLDKTTVSSSVHSQAKSQDLLSRLHTWAVSRTEKYDIIFTLTITSIHPVAVSMGSPWKGVPHTCLSLGGSGCATWDSVHKHQDLLADINWFRFLQTGCSNSL